MDLNLENREWKAFKIGDIFIIKSGYHLLKRDMKKGNLPFIGASDSNNGITEFVSNSNNSQDKNVIGVNWNGSVVENFYHPYTAIFSGDVKRLTLKKIKGNKYLFLFIKTTILKQKEKYSYGYKFNGQRMAKQNILLPINSKGEPDYDFMEQFIRHKEQKKQKEYQEYIQRRINQLKNTPKTVPLSEKEWREFELGSIFNINSGVRLTKANMQEGDKPFIGATDSNNGITEFVSNTNKSEDRNVLGVNYNGSVVENFYHPYTAVFSDDVKRLTLRNIDGNEFLYLFMKTAILKQKVKYRYGYKFNATRMKKQKILLPINKNNKPDYTFMENYIKNLEYKKLIEYIKFKKMTA